MSKEYFIIANSFAAPFFSDESTHFVKADSPEAALQQFAEKEYDHPCGLYSAAVYASSDAYHKEKPGLKRWLSNHAAAIEQSEATSVRSDDPGTLVLDGKAVKVTNPKGGKVFDW
jgi:hypothetical protein